MSDYARLEPCPVCEIHMDRIWTIPYLTGTSVESAEFNPALGCVTKNSKHRAEIAKQKGLIEIGNDFGTAEKMQAKFDKDRAEKLKKTWDEE